MSRYTEPPAIPAPAPGVWTLAAGQLIGNGVRQPILVVTGASDDPAARFVRIEYIQAISLPPSPAWIDSGIFGPDVQRREISGAVTMALILDTQFVMDWRRADNTVVTLDKAGMIDVGLSIGMHSATCQANKNALDTLVDAEVTVADLEAVDIESGWPV